MLGLIFVGLLNLYVSKEFIVHHIGSNSILSAVKASILGVPLPLCSCGVIPTAAHLSRNGASNGAVVSFLISTPQTGIDSIIATYGMMGPIFAIFRPFAAFISGITGGIIANFLNDKTSFSFPKKDEHPTCQNDSCSGEDHKHKSKVKIFYDYAFKEFLDDISIQMLIGIIIAALISFFIPEDFFIRHNIGVGFTGMLLMIAIGLPMYICATSSIPIALALMSKGISPGAAFVFLSVGPLTNAASITILLKLLKKKILIIYLLSGTISAVIFGMLLDFIFSYFQMTIPSPAVMQTDNSSILNVIYYTGTIIFTVFLMFSIYRNLKSKLKGWDHEKK